MIQSSYQKIIGGKHNRYTITIATAKAARFVTEEYMRQRDSAEKMIARKETDKSISSMINNEIRDEKAIKTAIRRLQNNEYDIIVKE